MLRLTRTGTGTGAAVKQLRPSRPAVSGLLLRQSVRGAASSAPTAHISEDQEMQILKAQRAARPTSPHLSVYRPQITWYGSGAHRITGVGLSAGMYGFALAYLTQGLHGIPLDSASIAAAFGSLPVFAKISLKSVIGLMFSYHAINGVRHLTWDTGKMLSNRAVIISGFTVVGLSVASTIALLFL